MTRRALLPLLSAVLLTLSAACNPTGADAAGDEQVAAALPDWVTRVYPEPGQASAPVRDVQVEHLASEPDEGIRLSIDGTDVTAYAQEGRGLLVYDPDRDDSGQPVDLSPGPHTATVELLRLDPETGWIEETVDTFQWEFTIQ
jgi:hypothetical protein